MIENVCNGITLTKDDLIKVITNKHTAFKTTWIYNKQLLIKFASWLSPLFEYNLNTETINNLITNSDSHNKRIMDNLKSVYIIECNDETIKIGVSKNPIDRLNTIETSSGKRIINQYVTDKIEMAFALEKMLHDYFYSFRLNGEWFKGKALQFNQVIEILEINLPKYL